MQHCGASRKKCGTVCGVIKFKKDASMLQQCMGSIHVLIQGLIAMAEALQVEAGDAQMQVRELNIQIKNKIFKQQKRIFTDEKIQVEGAAQLDLYGQMGAMHRRKVWERYLAVRDRATSGLSQTRWVQYCASQKF